MSQIHNRLQNGLDYFYRSARPRFIHNWRFASDEEAIITQHLEPPTLHLFSGHSKIGDTKIDAYTPLADIRADAWHIPIRDEAYQTTLLDPFYKMDYKLRPLLAYEAQRVTKLNGKIITKAQWIPLTRHTRIEATWITIPATNFYNTHILSILRKTQSYLPSTIRQLGEP